MTHWSLQTSVQAASSLVEMMSITLRVLLGFVSCISSLRWERFGDVLAVFVAQLDPRFGMSQCSVFVGLSRGLGSICFPLLFFL